LRKRIIAFHEADPALTSDPERKAVIENLRKGSELLFPYPFAKNYNYRSIEVFKDEASGMHYVLQDGKKLFFKRRWKPRRIRKAYAALAMEQDPMSPHKYLSHEFDIAEGEVLADIGAAEGNFSLALIERVSKVYLFECDTEWIEALEKTFEPWKEKVEIVRKFVSDRNDDEHVKGDDFFADKQLDFLKIDVDGGERDLLKGCRELISRRRPLKVALCTYHLHDDEEEFRHLLLDNGFSVSHTLGFMIFYYDKDLRPPYLRRVLLRASKQ
jgi:hypothetical protein